jgi:pseudouridine-5'-phosphate glycosidase
MAMDPGLFRASPEVADAIAAGRPVVALESTLVTHGLPPRRNLDAARRAEAAVRSGGAVPATIAISDGHILVGLMPEELEALAASVGPAVGAGGRLLAPKSARRPALGAANRDVAPSSTQRPAKVSTRDLAAALGRRGWSGATVSATMIAAHRTGIRVFATGGIGGVHRGGELSLDVSADLAELARTPVAVVCAGPKSILDVRRTLEVLESSGVPVVGWGTDEVPGFLSRSSGWPASARVDGAAEAAALLARQWALGLGGVLFCVPLPEDEALPRDVAEAAIETALRDAEAAGVHGPASTPFVLARVADLTEGRSVEANLALIEHNARVAAEIAGALSQPLRPDASATG